MSEGGEGAGVILAHVWDRFMELLNAPASEPQMLWFAIPLIFATLMMTLYFGRYRKEELGWNTAFENTMIFLFISFDLVRRMYYSAEPYGWANIFANPLYFMITVGLALVSIVSMLLVYYHLLPKRVTFLLFSKLPINIALYVTMTIVYAGVAADWVTVGAGALLFIVVWVVIKAIQMLQAASARKHDEEEKGAWEENGDGKYELEEKDEKEGVEEVKVNVGKGKGKRKGGEPKGASKEQKG